VVDRRELKATIARALRFMLADDSPALQAGGPAPAAEAGTTAPVTLPDEVAAAGRDGHRPPATPVA
jgi:hypothetical protein